MNTTAATAPGSPTPHKESPVPTTFATTTTATASNIAVGAWVCGDVSTNQFGAYVRASIEGTVTFRSEGARTGDYNGYLAVRVSRVHLDESNTIEIGDIVTIATTPIKEIATR